MEDAQAQTQQAQQAYRDGEVLSPEEEEEVRQAEEREAWAPIAQALAAGIDAIDPDVVREVYPELANASVFTGRAMANWLPSHIDGIESTDDLQGAHVLPQGGSSKNEDARGLGKFNSC